MRQGEALRSGLRQALEGVAGVVEVRGMGLMVGVELDHEISIQHYERWSCVGSDMFIEKRK